VRVDDVSGDIWQALLCDIPCPACDYDHSTCVADTLGGDKHYHRVVLRCHRLLAD